LTIQVEWIDSVEDVEGSLRKKGVEPYQLIYKLVIAQNFEHFRSYSTDLGYSKNLGKMTNQKIRTPCFAKTVFEGLNRTELPRGHPLHPPA